MPNAQFIAVTQRPAPERKVVPLGHSPPTPSCGRERDKREGQYVHVSKHRCSTQTLARVSRPRLSSPSHHPDEADDPPRDQPFARAPREMCGTSRTPLAERDQPHAKPDSRCEPSRAPRDRGIRSRPTARSRGTIPPGINHSRARRETFPGRKNHQSD